MSAVREQRVAVPGGEVWCRRMGAGGVPLLIVNGGPGLACDMMFHAFEPLADEREVLWYDQLGTGRSDPIADPSLITVERFLDEVGAVIDGLGLERPHVYGHSWGAMLTMQYAAERAPDWSSLVCDGGLADVDRFSREVRELMAGMPGNVLDRFYGRELAGETDDPDYMVAGMEFVRAYLLRNEDPPTTVSLDRSTADASRATRETLWGRYGDHHVTGTLKNWDIMDKLGDIRLPTLVMGGELDVSVPSHLADIASRIPDSEHVTRPDATHIWFLEEEPLRSEGAALVRDFLARVEARARESR